MPEYLPVLIIGAIIGVFSLLFVMAYWLLRRSKPKDYDRQMKDSEIMKRLMHYAKPYKGQFVWVAVVLLFSIIYDVVSPMLVGHVIDVVQKEGFELSYLFGVVAVYASILIVSTYCTYLKTMILQRIGQKILSALREDLFVHIESLSHEQLNNIPVGKLVTRVTNDTNAITFLFTNILATLLRHTMAVLGVLGAMLLLNYTLTLMVLCFAPVLVLFTLVFRKFSRTVHRQVSNRTTDINTYLSENLSGIKITQAFNQEENKYREFCKRSKALEKAKYGRLFVFGVFRPMVYMLNISCVMCLLWLSSKAHIGGLTFLGQTITAATVVSFYMYISKFFSPIQILAEHFDMLQKSFASSEKIFTIMDMAPQMVDDEDAMELDEIKGEIEFKDVWFAYKEDEWVLKGVSFHVAPKQTVAFVGSTGSGKTTILSLICRNYDIQKGQILIDGIDIRKIKTSSLRRHFGQMLQDVFLFSGDIRSNIILREENISDEEVMAAAKYVNADSFINRLEAGLNETVRERGNNFSAGQRQLLSFARTIVHKPSVMILDEATANIDTETELLIQDSLERMKNIGTMLIVAHRLSTIQHADNIILLSQGKIIEQGDHQTLLEKKGRYHQLYTLQYTKQQLEKA